MKAGAKEKSKLRWLLAKRKQKKLQNEALLQPGM